MFVASVVRGLSLYHEQHGATSSGFRALMPVNVRGGGEGRGGNHFVPARFVIPVHTDVADCMAEVRKNAAQWKHAPGLALSDVMATVLSALPAVVARNLWSSMLLGDDFCITNIPGPPFQAFLAGTGSRGFTRCRRRRGPRSTCRSCPPPNRACITITADVAAVPDSPKLAACIEDGFAEVCSARRAGPPAVGMTTPTDALTPLDASFLYMESDHTPMHMGFIGIFEGGPLHDARGCLRLDELRAEVESRLHLVPKLRKVVRFPALRRGRAGVGRRPRLRHHQPHPPGRAARRPARRPSYWSSAPGWCQAGSTAPGRCGTSG